MEAITIIRKNSLQDPVEQSVLNKKVTLPPKQIITKQYSADVKPIMKLITKQQLQKSQKNIAYLPPKIKNQQYQKYGQKFRITDFLGYHYAEQLDQMIYFRFNNQQFNQFHQNISQKLTKYFSGLFIPLKTLHSKHFKTSNNIYQCLNITLPEIKDSITQSFAKNCKGCSLDPVFSSNYTSGNLMAAIRKKPFQYDLIIQNDINCKAAEWFNFAVKFIQEGTYTFNIVNLSTQNLFYQNGMKIPYFSFLQQSFKSQSGLQNALKSGSGWAYGGRNIKLTKSQIRKQNQLFDHTYFCLSFQFKCKNRHQTVVFANSIPYTPLDYERFMNRVLYNKIVQHMKMQKIQICSTIAGNSLSAYLFYHRKSKSNTMILKSVNSQQKLNSNEYLRSNQKHRTLNLNTTSTSQNSNSNILNLSLSNGVQSNSNTTKSIVFMARQHSGQTGSSFVMQGIVQFLMDNTQFDVFKKNFQFIVIPFINIDGVNYGNQKVNLAGSDLNKVWKNPNQNFQPQVYHVKKFLKTINQAHPISLFVNLQCNNHRQLFINILSLNSYFSSSTTNTKKYSLFSNQNDQPTQLYPYICSKRIPQISFSKCQFYNNNINTSKKPSSLIATLTDLFPKSLVYSFSTSTYGWKNQNSGFRKYTESSTTTQEEQHAQSPPINQFTPDVYRNLGRQLISTYLQYVRLCDKNIGIKDRWLKQIQSLSSTIIDFKNKDTTICEQNQQKKYEQTWNRELVRYDFSSFLPPASEMINQRGQVRKHKTSLMNRQSGISPPNQGRSKSKKLTMPNLKNNRYSKQQKQNTQKASMTAELANRSQKISLNRNNNSQMESILSQFKKSPLSSSIFTPKRRSQILRQISQSIKQSSTDKQSSFVVNNQNNITGVASPLQTILQKKQKPKKISQMLMNVNELQILQPNSKNSSGNLSAKTKLTEAIVKFENMKKFITSHGIKSNQSINNNGLMSNNSKDINLMIGKQRHRS